MSEIIIPPLGESITEATIASIQKKVGDFVEVDELLIELETDKVTLEVNAQVSGVISELTVSEGDTVRVAQVIGAINPQESSVKSQPEVKKAEPVLTPSSEKIVAPSAQRIITENKLELSKIEGSGRDGRVMKEDALQAAHKSTPITPSSKVSDREEIAAPMTRLRQTIAKRLKDSQNTAAILTTFNEIDMSALMDLRKEYQDIFVKKYGIKVGFMSFFVRAACVILNEIPAINAEIRGNDIIYKNYCDIGVAVGTDKGLVVPIIRDAQNMGFAEVEQSIYNFGMKAKKVRLECRTCKAGLLRFQTGGRMVLCSQPQL